MPNYNDERTHGAVQAPITQVVQLFTPAISHIRYSIEEDHYGDISLFLRIVLTDEAAKLGTYIVCKKITLAVQNRLRLIELDLFPYFNWRSASEQAKLQHPDWAQKPDNSPHALHQV